MGTENGVTAEAAAWQLLHAVEEARAAHQPCQGGAPGSQQPAATLRPWLTTGADAG